MKTGAEERELNHGIHPKGLRGVHGKILFEEESFAIRGAAFETYRELGCGFLEAVYQKCFGMELNARNIPTVAQPELELSYKGKLIELTYRPDFVCFDKIIVELKAVKSIQPEHKAQVINYLKATNLRLGLLINFGHYPDVEIERIVL